VKAKRDLICDEACGPPHEHPRTGSARLKAGAGTLAVLRRTKIEATAQGFCITFRHRVSGRAQYGTEVPEMALADAVGEKFEAAYRRGDLHDKSVRGMSDWASSLANGWN
jgi:hypothetical protein